MTVEEIGKLIVNFFNYSITAQPPYSHVENSTRTELDRLGLTAVMAMVDVEPYASRQWYQQAKDDTRMWYADAKLLLMVNNRYWRLRAGTDKLLDLHHQQATYMWQQPTHLTAMA